MSERSANDVQHGLRIILNVDAITSPLTGIGRYALQLACGLQRHPDVSDIRFYAAYRWIDEPTQALTANQTIAALRKHTPYKVLALHLYNWVRSAIFRWHTRAFSDYLLHTPNYVLIPFQGPAVTTIHDLSFIHYPQYHPRERVAFLEKQLPRTLNQAAAIITDSEFVRREVRDILGVPAHKITAIPLGVDSGFRPHSLDELVPALKRYSLVAGRYLLAVATLEPRKNLARLVEAYCALPDHLQQRYPLVFAGARGWLSEALEKQVATLEQRGRVRYLGYVVQQDLPSLYAGARGFAFPSLYEGFGLPVIEAMASGVPVLTSNCSSLLEVAGNAALTVDPEDVDAIRFGLEIILEDEGRRNPLVTAGLIQSGNFSWENCIQRTVELYQRVLTSHNGKS